MFNYNIQINNGVQAFGKMDKTITVNEVVQTADLKALAREINHENMLIPVQVAESVLENFTKAAINLMSQGFAIQFKSGDDVIMRIYPDMHVKGGNINLQRAQELIPGTTEITKENAGELVSRAGVTVRAYAECGRKFTEQLLAMSSGIQRNDIIEKDCIMMNGSGGTTPSDPGTGGGTTPETPDPGTGGGGSNDNPGGSGGGSSEVEEG